MELLHTRLTNLLTVKSLVTIILTTVFAWLSVVGKVSANQFLTIFTVVIGFYFGTQAEKKAQSDT
jgi:phosphoribosylaminoimidazole (AIR) synthetase